MEAMNQGHRPKVFTYALLAGVVLALVATIGCQQFAAPQTYSAAQLEPAIPTGRFHDVPVPSTFRPISDRTFVFENPSLKAGILVYKGKLSVTDTVNFFKDHMPANGWRMVSSLEVKDVIMKFEKVGWTCDVTVRRGFEREITIYIGPTGNGSEQAVLVPPPS
ncbi:MAG: hypothetical protein IH788_03725 [Nitrospinae bacterium]|nr:hypothetical protein [Nitrospinota bacterium]